VPNPQFTKPWHGVPREQIAWNPRILEDTCIGCGTCVTGCSRLVYRFDFERKKPVVVDPLNCMVGCTTCANTCPAHAIAFPPIESVLALEARADVRHAVEDDLVARKDILSAAGAGGLPHPDRIVALSVAAISRPTPDVMRVTLAPVNPGECFCEFTPGQYLELWEPESTHLSRAYSIANSPHGDGRIELHIRRVEGGRFTDWAFGQMKQGDRLQARGPLGGFTMRSPAWVPLLFVAGGTGFAPVLALLDQQARFDAAREMTLVWGMRRSEDFYALDAVEQLLGEAPNLRVLLVAEAGAAPGMAIERLDFRHGGVLDALRDDAHLLVRRDVYAAGPPAMLRELSQTLGGLGVEPGRVHIDSFGV
jgi:CDP-4-dehydro-6-deoxyglucose reductase